MCCTSALVRRRLSNRQCAISQELELVAPDPCSCGVRGRTDAPVFSFLTMAFPFQAPTKKYPSEKVYLEINFHHAFQVKKQYENSAGEMWTAIAKRHRMMLFRRFVALSARQPLPGEVPQWPPLSPETLKRKERLRQQYPGFFPVDAKVSWILRATNRLMRAIDYQTRKDGYDVGYIKDSTYPRLPSDSDGKRRVYSAKTVLQLAEIHHHGKGRVPKRSLSVRPDRKTYRTLVDMATRYFGKFIERANNS